MNTNQCFRRDYFLSSIVQKTDLIVKYVTKILVILRILKKVITNIVQNIVQHNHQKEIKLLQTFADLRISTGSMYDKFGFTFSHNSSPGYVYYKGGVVKNRQEFQKHKLKDILPIFDESISEISNLKNNGWIRVFDCGQACYVLTRQ